MCKGGPFSDIRAREYELGHFREELLEPSRTFTQDDCLADCDGDLTSVEVVVNMSLQLTANIEIPPPY